MNGLYFQQLATKLMRFYFTDFMMEIEIKFVDDENVG